MAPCDYPKGTDHMVFVPAAGYRGSLRYRRDTLSLLQTMIVYPEFAAGALEVLDSIRRRSGRLS